MRKPLGQDKRRTSWERDLARTERQGIQKQFDCPRCIFSTKSEESYKEHWQEQHAKRIII